MDKISKNTLMLFGKKLAEIKTAQNKRLKMLDNKELNPDTVKKIKEELFPLSVNEMEMARALRGAILDDPDTAAELLANLIWENNRMKKERVKK